MLLDNTRAIPRFLSDQPGSYLRARGYLAGRPVFNVMDEFVGFPQPAGYTEIPGLLHRGALGAWDAAYRGNLGDGDATAWTQSDISSAMTALNSEALFLLNLARGQAGLAPLPQTYAPGVNVGLSGGAMLAIAGLAYALLKR